MNHCLNRDIWLQNQFVLNVMRFCALMIYVIVLLLVLDDVQFSALLLVAVLLPASDTLLALLCRLAFTFGSSVLKPDFNLETVNI